MDIFTSGEAAWIAISIMIFIAGMALLRKP
jgi:hypothetical protein